MAIYFVTSNKNKLRGFEEILGFNSMRKMALEKFKKFLTDKDYGNNKKENMVKTSWTHNAKKNIFR